jgi:hypothetical protein
MWWWRDPYRAYANTGSHLYTNTCCYADSYTHSRWDDTHADANTDTDWTDADTNAYANTYPYTNANANFHTYSNPHADADSHADTHPYADSRSICWHERVHDD